jgi:hypothetical protein
VRVLDVNTALVNPATLTLADRNPRRGDVQELVKSFRSNGFWGTVIVDRATGQVLASNHRVKAARELAMPEIPVSYIQTDNPAHATCILLAELQRDPSGLEGTGYTELDLAQFVAELRDGAFQDDLIDKDEVPELPEGEQVVSREGDVWQVGPHRVGCGNSTSAEHVARLMNGALAKLVWTDPPYNVDYEGKTKDRLKIANDAMTPEQFQAFLGALFKTTGRRTRQRWMISGRRWPSGTACTPVPWPCVRPRPPRKSKRRPPACSPTNRRSETVPRSVLPRRCDVCTECCTKQPSGYWLCDPSTGGYG